MPPEGMVHALELVHSLLFQDGLLVDLHPTGQPPLVEVAYPRKTYPLGELQETDDFIEYAQANEALSIVLQTNRFRRIRQATFTFITYADSLEELKAFLLENWSDAIWPEQIDLHAKQVSQLEHQRRVRAALREQTSISSFRRTGS